MSNGQTIQRNGTMQTREELERAMHPVQHLRRQFGLRGVQTISPNAKCPCGSGKKHKKCCLWASKAPLVLSGPPKCVFK